MTLPALSLWQPWASLMAHGMKVVETRPPWAMRLRHLIGSDLAICSTKGMPSEAIAALADRSIFEPLRSAEFADLRPRTVLDVAERLPRGSVLAVVRVAAVTVIGDPDDAFPDMPGRAYLHAYSNVPGPWALENNTLWIHPAEEPFGDYTPGRIAIATEDLRRLAEPVPCSGRQQVWNLSDDVAAAVREQVGA